MVDALDQGVGRIVKVKERILENTPLSLSLITENVLRTWDDERHTVP